MSKSDRPEMLETWRCLAQALSLDRGRLTFMIRHRDSQSGCREDGGGDMSTVKGAHLHTGRSVCF